MMLWNAHSCFRFDFHSGSGSRSEDKAAASRIAVSFAEVFSAQPSQLCSAAVLRLKLSWEVEETLMIQERRQETAHGRMDNGIMQLCSSG